MIRQPIITVLGHVDHGKTSLLDWIRGTTLAQREAGLITQHIGATEVPLETVRKICGDLLFSNMKFSIPGLLFIDTPGHEAFTNLRKRGGSIADIAILVVDINQGVELQTKEAIEILKTFKVPFVVAANKIDIIPGWKLHNKVFIKNIEKQIQSTKEVFENRFYSLLGAISELGFSPEIYNKISDYTKELAVVPLSAKTGEGIAELLAVLTGLAQRFLSKQLEVKPKEPARGTILEIKEEKGIGTVADVIIYEGSLRKDDLIIVGGVDDVVETKIRSLLKPAPLSEIRDQKSRFKQADEVIAASGVRIVATGLDKAIAGAPFASAHSKKEAESLKKKILDEISEVLISTEEEGIILKADTLGSLEAASNLFKQQEIPIKLANIGDINKKDIMAAAANLAVDPLKAFVLGFSVKISDSVKKLAEESKITVITDSVIYKVVEKYQQALEEKKKKIELEKLSGLVWPCRFKILPQYIFRQSNPAIFGAQVLVGKLKPKTRIMDSSGEPLGEIKSIEDQGKQIEELGANQQAAVSVPGLVLGRHASGGDILLVDLTEDQFRLLKTDAKKFLNKGEIELLKEIVTIKRKEKENWGF